MNTILQTDTEQMVLFLCWRAGVKPCRVDWSARHVRGCYRPDQAAIKVGPSDRGAAIKGLNRILHEVAHHVVHARGAEARGVKIPKRPAARAAFYRKFPGLRPVGWERLSAASSKNVAVWKRWGAIHHGPVFVETLRELASHWYGDATAYPWEDEYRSIRAAGRQGR